MIQLNEQVSEKYEVVELDKTKLPEGVLARVVYPICNIGERNKNNRVYEKTVWDKVLSNPELREKLENRSLFGQAEHPEKSLSNLEKTSHVVNKMWIDEDAGKVKQEMDILDTEPYGRIVDTLIRAECGVGVSTRAEGDLEEANDDQGSFMRVLPDSYNYITTDFTADPSTIDPYPESVQVAVVSEVEAGLAHNKCDAKFATSILEHMKVKEAIQLLEAIQKEERKVPKWIKEKRLKEYFDVDSLLTFDEAFSEKGFVEEYGKELGSEVYHNLESLIKEADDKLKVVIEELKELGIVGTDRLPDGFPTMWLEGSDAWDMVPRDKGEALKDYLKGITEFSVEDWLAEEGLLEESKLDKLTDEQLIESYDKEVNEDILSQMEDEIMGRGYRKKEEKEEKKKKRWVKVVEDNGSDDSNIDPSDAFSKNFLYFAYSDIRSNDPKVVKISIADLKKLWRKALQREEGTGLQSLIHSDLLNLYSIQDISKNTSGSKVGDFYIFGFAPDKEEAMRLYKKEEGGGVEESKTRKTKLFECYEDMVKYFQDAFKDAPDEEKKKIREVIKEAVEEKQDDNKALVDAQIEEALARAERDKIVAYCDTLYEKIDNKDLEIKLMVKKMREAAATSDKPASVLEKKLVAVSLALEKRFNEVKELKSKAISSVSKHVSEVKMAAARLKKVKEDYTKQIDDINKEHGEKLVECNEAYNKDLVKKFVNMKLESSGLRVPKNVQALLEKASSTEEAEKILKEVKEAIAEGALHPDKPLTEVTVPVELDEEVVKIHTAVGTAMKGM